jgi:hypothetical protein
VVVALSGRPAALYDAAAGLWAQLRVYLGMALELTGTPGRDLWKTYWAAQQRFFKLLCVSLKVPAVVEQVRRGQGDGGALWQVFGATRPEAITRGHCTARLCHQLCS